MFAGWQAVITHRLTVEGADIADAEAIAATTVAAIEGAVILCLAAQSINPLDKTARMLDTLIAEHTSDEPPTDSCQSSTGRSDTETARSPSR